MKKLLAVFCILVFTHCNKEEAKQDAVILAMTAGQWKVTSFVNNGSDITTDFTGYLFKFNQNLTVDALKNSTIEKTGTWTADATSKTITSTFSNASATLTLFNGTWTINDSGWDFVVASFNGGGDVRSLRLQKN
jgi:hypothetical protein